MSLFNESWAVFKTMELLRFTPCRHVSLETLWHLLPRMLGCQSVPSDDFARVKAGLRKNPAIAWDDAGRPAYRPEVGFFESKEGLRLLLQERCERGLGAVGVDALQNIMFAYRCKAPKSRALVDTLVDAKRFINDYNNGEQPITATDVLVAIVESHVNGTQCIVRGVIVERVDAAPTVLRELLAEGKIYRINLKGTPSRVFYRDDVTTDAYDMDLPFDAVDAWKRAGYTSITSDGALEAFVKDPKNKAASIPAPF